LVTLLDGSEINDNFISPADLRWPKFFVALFFLWCRKRNLCSNAFLRSEFREKSVGLCTFFALAIADDLLPYLRLLSPFS
jgi:hypothetical protein